MECEGDIAKRIERYITGDLASANCLEQLGLREPFAPRLQLIIAALKRGIQLNLTRISRVLTWEEFEKLIKYIIENLGYSVLTNVNLECGRRAEFDVIAWNYKWTLIIEAKKWKFGGIKWRDVAAGHLRKIETCLSKLSSFGKTLIPLVIASTDVQLVVDGVPVVSISKLINFISQLDIYIYDIKKINI